MTRLLVTADWHSGAGAEYGRTPTDRLADQTAAFHAIADLAADEQVDAVLFAGDLTHRNLPTPGALGAATDALGWILDAGIPVVAISGNSHDVAHPDERIGLELVSARGTYQLRRRPGILEPWSNPGRPAIACLPWAPDTRLASAREAGARSDVRAEMAEHLIAVAAGMRAEIGDRPAILMLHYSVAGGRSASGAQAELFGETVLPLAELQAQRWTAVACGHLHAYQVLSTDPLVFYPGPPAIVDFGEAGQAHGCVLLDVDDQTGTVEHRFVEISGRPFVTIDTDGEMLGDNLLVVPPAVAGAVVRLRYTATPDQARRVDHHAITRALYDAGAHKVYEIKAEITRADRGRLDDVLEHLQTGHEEGTPEGTETPATIDAAGLSPLQLIDAWIASQGLDETAAAALRDRTSAYLEGRAPAVDRQEAAA